MADPYIGEIRIFAGNFAPQDWAFCDGQLLPIQGNELLFSVLYTTYGGDGRTNFAMPDLRGRLPMHQGSGSGLSPRKIAQKFGREWVWLTTDNLPAHNHPMQASKNLSDSRTPEGNVLPTPSLKIYNAGENVRDFPESAVGEAGHASPAPHDNMMPYVGLNFIIALKGVHPPRPNSNGENS